MVHVVAVATKGQEVVRGVAAVVGDRNQIVADADGRNARTVASARSDHAINPIFGSVDWR
jgi:hypothetical protein